MMIWLKICSFPFWNQVLMLQKFLRFALSLISSPHSICYSSVATEMMSFFEGLYLKLHICCRGSDWEKLLFWVFINTQIYCKVQNCNYDCFILLFRFIVSLKIQIWFRPWKSRWNSYSCRRDFDTKFFFRSLLRYLDCPITSKSCTIFALSRLPNSCFIITIGLISSILSAIESWSVVKKAWTEKSITLIPASRSWCSESSN